MRMSNWTASTSGASGRRDRAPVPAYDGRVTVDARSAPDRLTVRRVARRERARVAAMLAESFVDDALSRWIYRDHPARMRWVRADFRLRLAQHGADGLAFVTPELTGAAIWAAPDHWKGHPSGQLRAFGAIPRVARNHHRITAMQRELDRRHPATPHFYLALLGVASERRRTGLATALLAPGLAQADRRSAPAYVEAGSAAAAALYERVGFRAVGEVRVADAPTVTLMWREPR
jgi:ribosomal protein S18 acetylase RimI-like enzyme